MITEFAYLQDLARSIRAHFPSRNTVVQFDSTEDVYATMLSGLLDESLTDESALRARLTAAGYSSRSYMVERNQLKEKLFNMLFLLKLTKTNASGYRIASFENSRAIFITQALLIFGLRGFATRTIRKGLAEATKFEFTAHRLLFLQLLSQEASQTGDKQELAELHKETAVVLELMGAEVEAAQLSEKVAALLVVTGSSNRAIVGDTVAAVNRLKALFERYDTFNLGMKYYMYSAIGSELQGDYGAAIDLCDAATRFLRDHLQFDSPTFQASFELRKLECALHEQNYEAATDAAQECKRLYAPGNLNWLVFMESLLMLQMHTGQFELAKSTLADVTTHDRFGVFPEHRIQRWSLYGYYLEYAQGNYSDLSLANQRLATLRRMIHSTADYGRDKTGFNLAIVVLDFLILLESKQYGALSESLESLQKYRQRHLQDDPEVSRFVRLLIEIARSTNSLATIKRAGQAFSKSEKLSANTRPRKVIDRLEILRYDWIAAKILTQLEEDLSDKPKKKKLVKTKSKRGR